MSNRFWAVLAIVAVLFVGVAVLSKDDKKEVSNATVSSHIYGKSDKGITLTEYGDFQCPYCGQFYPTVKQVAEKYKDTVKFQFSHYPLQQVHQNAFAAARASEAADKQGKFWEMYDLLYSQQAAWSNSNSAQSVFTGYAKQLGLNTDQFKTDYSSKATNDTINADMQAFDKLKLRVATPTFLLNGKQIKPDNSVESFSKILDEALAAKADKKE